MCTFSLESEKMKHLVAKIELSPKVFKEERNAFFI